MKLGIGISLAVIAELAACGGPPSPKPVPVSGDDCDAAERRLSELGCREARSPSGRGYGSICRDVAQVGVDLHPACVARVRSCDEVRSCR